MQNLPKELFLEIISKTDPNTLLHNFRYVNKEIFDFISNLDVHYVINFVNYNVTTGSRSTVLQPKCVIGSGYSDDIHNKCETSVYKYIHFCMYLYIQKCKISDFKYGIDAILRINVKFAFDEDTIYNLTGLELKFITAHQLNQKVSKIVFFSAKNISSRWKVIASNNNGTLYELL